MWMGASRIPGLIVTISCRTFEQLANDGVYPIPSELRLAMRAKGVDEFDMPTLQTVINSIARLTPSLEQRTRVLETLHDEVTSDPEVLQTESLEQSLTEAAANFVKVGLSQEHLSDGDCFAVALTSKGSSSLVRIQAKVHEAEVEEGWQLELPLKMNTQVNVCSSLEELADVADLGLAFQSAANDPEMVSAIKMELLRSRRLRHVNGCWEDLPDILIGRDFRDRAQGLIGGRPSLKQTILDSIVEVYDRLNQGKTHDLREGESGASNQRVHDKWSAWRHDVARDVHLHYWVHEKGLRELAWVSHPHDDMYIPAPTH